MNVAARGRGQITSRLDGGFCLSWFGSIAFNRARSYRRPDGEYTRGDTSTTPQSRAASPVTPSHPRPGAMSAVYRTAADSVSYLAGAWLQRCGWSCWPETRQRRPVGRDTAPPVAALYEHNLADRGTAWCSSLYVYNCSHQRLAWTGRWRPRSLPLSPNLCPAPGRVASHEYTWQATLT